MIALLGRRALSAAATLAVLVLLAFLLMHLAPGGTAAFFDDPNLPPDARARLRANFGLDRPLPAQLVAYAGRLAHGDLGISLHYDRPVGTLLGDALGPSLLLAGTGLALAFALGLALGTRAALRPGGVADGVVRRVLPALDALPPFWVGMLGVWLFAARLGWLPAGSMAAHDGGGLLDRLRHLVLPVLVIGIPGAAPVARHHAAALARELAAGPARLGRAMGLTRGNLLAWSIRPALQPALTLLGLSLPALAGGTAVVEVVFAWPGLGRLQQEALLARDLPLALGGLLLSGALVIGGGALADAAGAWLDPRRRRRTP